MSADTQLATLESPLDLHGQKIRHAHRALGGAMEQAGTWAVLLGMELAAAHAALGVRAGKPSNSATVAELSVVNSATVAELNWKDWLEVQCPGISERSARRYIALAKAAKSTLLKSGEDVIRALLDKPSADLSEEDRAQLHGAIRKAADGKTFEQLALDFGMTGPGRRTLTSGKGNGAATKAADAGPRPGWTEDEEAEYAAADAQARDAIDCWRPIARGIAAEIEAGTLAHLPAVFRADLAEQCAALAAKLKGVKA